MLCDGACFQHLSKAYPSLCVQLQYALADHKLKYPARAGAACSCGLQSGSVVER
jgi:hypothetical protein